MAKLPPRSPSPSDAIARATLPRSSRPGLRRKPFRKFGPDIYQLDKEAEIIDGPGEPPVDFLSGKTSKPEWMLYWGMSKVHGVPVDPRIGPYEGDHGGIWAYQRYFPILGITGKTNVDFVYYGGGYWIGIRLQSEKHHLMTDAAQQVLDEYLGSHNPGLDQIVDVFEQHFLSDPTGDAACKVMALASKGIGYESYLRTGGTFRISGVR